jgi:hypothetical protein
MPTVRKYERQVYTDALPGVRKTAAETPLSTGVGVEQARGDKIEALGRVGAIAGSIGTSAYAKIAHEERQRAIDLALLTSSNELDKVTTELLYSPDKGALTRRGKDVFDLPGKVMADFDAAAGKIEQGLGTDQQRAAFLRVKLQHGANLNQTVYRHTSQELQKYEAGELQAFVENKLSTAVKNATDPRRVGEELSSAIAAVKRSGPRLGLGPEQLTKQVEALTTATHVGVIEELLAQQQTSAAKIYFEETRDDIKGEATARVEKALRAGSVRADGQKQADAILARGGTLKEQREQARQIDDADVRDDVTQRLEHEAAVRDRAEREQDQDRLRSAYDRVDRTKSVTSIPPGEWAQLDGSARSSLRSYATSLAKGVAIETDLPTYYAAMQRAGDDPTAFATENLLRYKGTIGETEFKQLASLQLSIKNGDRTKAEKELGPTRLEMAVADDALALYGFDVKAAKKDPTSADGKAYAQFRNMLRRQVQAQHDLTGKQPTDVDVTGHADKLLSQSETVPGSWWNIFPGGKSFRDTSKRLIDLTISDVPAGDRTQIEAALRKRGRPVSDATVLDLFLEHRSRSAK